MSLTKKDVILREILCSERKTNEILHRHSQERERETLDTILSYASSFYNKKATQKDSSKCQKETCYTVQINNDMSQNELNSLIFLSLIFEVMYQKLTFNNPVVYFKFLQQKATQKDSSKCQKEIFLSLIFEVMYQKLIIHFGITVQIYIFI